MAENKAASLEGNPLPHPSLENNGVDIEIPDDWELARATIMQIDEDLFQVERELDFQRRKREKYAKENERRRHNYVPFVFALLKKLAEKGKLDGLVEKATEKTKERMAEMQRAKRASQ